MKKVMPVLASSMLVLNGAAHAEGPIDGKVYGKINAAYVSTDVGGVSDSYLESHASRIGFKGKTELDKGATLLYQLEYEVNPTEKNASSKKKCVDVTTPTGTANICDNNDSIFKQRNAFVGVGTQVGTVLLGIHDTPLKLAQGKIDLFNDLTTGDIKSLVRGEERATDVVVYSSPELSGFSAMVAMTQYEDGDEGKEDATSFSVTYEGVKDLYLSFAVDSEVAGYDVSRLAAQYKLGALTVGAMLNESQKANSNNAEESSTILSAAYKINDWNLKAQFGSGDERSKGREQASFGVDYKLGDKSKVYVYTSSLKDDVAGAAKLDESTTGFGVEHSF